MNDYAKGSNASHSKLISYTFLGSSTKTSLNDVQTNYVYCINKIMPFSNLRINIYNVIQSHIYIYKTFKMVYN